MPRRGQSVTATEEHGHGGTEDTEDTEGAMDRHGGTDTEGTMDRNGGTESAEGCSHGARRTRRLR